MPTKEIEDNRIFYLVDVVTGEKREINYPIYEISDISKLIAQEITSEDITQFFEPCELTAIISFPSNNKRRLSGKKLIPWRKLYRLLPKEVKREYSFEQWKTCRGILL